MRYGALASVFLGLMWPCVATAQQPAPSGAAVYKQRCANCHEGTLPRMPNRQGLAAMTPEHIESELASFSMRRQGASLSPAERRAVDRLERCAGRPAAAGHAAADAVLTRHRNITHGMRAGSRAPCGAPSDRIDAKR